MSTSDRVLIGVVAVLSALTLINTVMILVLLFAGMNGLLS
jgi:hypothetical protein